MKICQREADRIVDKQPKVIWKHASESEGCFTMEDCVFWSLLKDFLLADEGSLGHMNASLPHGIQKFSKHKYMQCLGVLLAKCLVPGPI